VITLIERHFFNACGVVAMAYLAYFLITRSAWPNDDHRTSVDLAMEIDPIVRHVSESDHTTEKPSGRKLPGYAVNRTEVDYAD